MASYNGVECKDSCKCHGNIKTRGGVFGWNKKKKGKINRDVSYGVCIWQFGCLLNKEK